MPVYEFYCPDCHTIFSFLSKSVDTKKKPLCPRCKKRQMERQISPFVMTGRGGREAGAEDLPIDEGKMEQAMTALASEAENINENDPRQAAGLMRKFSGMTGIEFGKSMEEALGRMEAGEDPEKIEGEMGNLIDGEEEPFVLPDKKGKGRGKKRRRSAPCRDETLYEM